MFYQLRILSEWDAVSRSLCCSNFSFFFMKRLLEYKHNIAYLHDSNRQEHNLFRLHVTTTGTLVLSSVIYSCSLTPYQ